MPREINIDLNVDQVGPHNRREDVARLIMVRACGFTRDGGTPTITDDCGTYPMLEGEAQRLKDEIDAALERARARFGSAKAAAEQPAPGRAAPAAAKPRIETGLKVRDVMTCAVRTVNRNDQLSVADELMKLGGFRHVVVLDDAGTVAGIVSRRDIFHGALAWSLGQGKAAHEKSLASYPVKQVMSAGVLTTAPDAELREAAALMAERKVGCLPVVDATKLVGILTEGDFVALLTGAVS
jgi:CBS domain-containing protein